MEYQQSRVSLRYTKPLRCKARGGVVTIFTLLRYTLAHVGHDFSRTGSMQYNCSNVSPGGSEPVSKEPTLGSADLSAAGLGLVRPPNLFSGVQLSEVRNIVWANWGSPEAVGVGEQEWVWPGTCDACNGASRATVVAFALGSCDGHASYNAVESYFPEYGQSFQPGDYENTCSHRGSYTEPLPPTAQCPDAVLAGANTAASVEVRGLSCAEADAVMLTLPEGPFLGEERWESEGFYCGTQGTLEFAGAAWLTMCEKGNHGEAIFFDASA